MNVELTHATIAKLALGPDDVVIVRSSERLTMEQTDQLGHIVKDAVGDHKVLILAPNLSVEVVAKGERA